MSVHFLGNFHCGTIAFFTLSEVPKSRFHGISKLAYWLHPEIGVLPGQPLLAEIPTNAIVRTLHTQEGQQTSSCDTNHKAYEACDHKLRHAELVVIIEPFS